MSEYYRKPIVKILMLKGKDGDGKGISSISKTGTIGLVDTYTIMLTDGTKSTFTVTNGSKGEKGDIGPQGQQGVKGDTGPQGPQGVKGQDGVSISNIEKKSTSGLTDTYEITLTDGTKRTFTVSNGKGIKSIAKTSTSGLTDTYTITYNDSTTSTFTVKNGESVESVKKWKKILEFTFDETEKMPNDIDVSNYTEFFVSIENVTNKGTTQSALILNFGQVKAAMTTQAKGTKSMCQQAYFRNNGLFLEQYICPICMDNSGVYDDRNTNIMSPYTRKLNPVLTPLKFSTHSAIYAIITGTIVIYAR